MQEYFYMNMIPQGITLDQRVLKLRLEMAKKKQQKLLRGLNG